MKHKTFPFDYSLTVSRKNKYLVVAAPDFGYQVNCVRLDLGPISTEALAQAVFQAWSKVSGKLRELEGKGLPPPKPRKYALLARELITTREVAKILGVSSGTVRKLALSGELSAERSPGGHFRFPLEDIADYLEQKKDLAHLYR